MFYLGLGGVKAKLPNLGTGASMQQAAANAHM